MPETYVRIAWPDGREDTVYSPSSTIREYLPPGAELNLREFGTRLAEGLDHASRRVAAIYGFACSASAAEKSRLLVAVQQAEAASGPTALVKILTVNTPDYGNPR